VRREEVGGKGKGDIRRADGSRWTVGRNRKDLKESSESFSGQPSNAESVFRCSALYVECSMLND